MRSRLVAATLLLSLAPAASWAAPDKAVPATALKVGSVAPDFTLQYFEGNDIRKLSLHDFRGKKNVMLGFYIFAFTGG